jgi:hypothetical protein
MSDFIHRFKDHVRLLTDGGVVAASVIHGLRDINETRINTLCGLPGIVKNEKLLSNCITSSVRDQNT